MVPRLRHDHPGYFLVACQILFIHGGLAVDAIINHHDQPQWRFVNDFIGFAGWAFIHTGVALVGLYGLYRNRIVWMRFAWFVSYLSFVVLSIELSVGTHQSGQSYALTVLLFAASLSSLAAFREDPINPAMRHGAMPRAGSDTKVATTPVVKTAEEGKDAPPHSVDVVLNTSHVEWPNPEEEVELRQEINN